jgi:hypothetical protein
MSELIQRRPTEIATRLEKPGGVHLCMENLSNISDNQYFQDHVSIDLGGVILVKDAP